jgi:hypothetical protein
LTTCGAAAAPRQNRDARCYNPAFRAAARQIEGARCLDAPALLDFGGKLEPERLAAVADDIAQLRSDVFKVESDRRLDHLLEYSKVVLAHLDAIDDRCKRRIRWWFRALRLERLRQIEYGIGVAHQVRLAARELDRCHVGRPAREIDLTSGDLNCVQRDQ